MTEAFLHYIWQYQHFAVPQLVTTDGTEIIVLKKGFLNTNAGPDFLQARLQIGEVEWAGTIEIHLKASDWNLHRHQTDKAYQNVILHVVWEADQPICRADGTLLPTLELKLIVSPDLLKKQHQLLDNQDKIPCEKQFSMVSDLAKIEMLDRVLLRRLEEKAAFVAELMTQSNDDLEEVAYQVLAKNFGFKLNAEPMLRLAEGLPLKVLQKHRNDLLQIEALLFGQAGFLEEATGHYAEKLKTEYQFLAQKYQLKGKQLAMHEWKFLRTRPANFPTIRLAQLAKLIHEQQSFFSLFTQTDDISLLQEKLAVRQSDYWQQHYLFDKKLAKPLFQIGKSSIENILINTVVPVLVFYSQYIDSEFYIRRAVSLLEILGSEKNYITEIWENMGFGIKNGYDSQASIELYNHYCKNKKCLSCSIGIEILRY